MNVEYRTQKDLPCDELYQLFLAVGWTTADQTTQAMIDHFNIGFLPILSSDFPQKIKEF